MKSIYLHHSPESGCSLHRVLYPSRFCAAELLELGIDIQIGDGVGDGSNEWVSFNGIPNETGVFEIAKMKRKGIRFMWSLDDDWLSIPDWNPAKPDAGGLAAYDLTKHMADRILVSTPALAKTFADVAEKVIVCPNLLDIAAYPPGPDHETKGSREYTFNLPIRVVWAGGKTHKGDVEILIEVMDRLFQRFDSKELAVVFFGMTPPSKLLRDYAYRGLLHQPPVPLNRYQSVVNSIAPNVWLAPLANIPFNESKSAIRVFEGWALNAAVVASPVGEYNCVQSGKDGRLAGDVDGWVSALARLVGDHQYRFDMACLGRQRVTKEYDWNRRECRLPWLKMFADLFNLGPIS